MTPESKARQIIDQKLAAAGWVVQDMKQINLGAASGVAVREFPTDTGPADYVLFVDRLPIGVIEAKRDEAGEDLTTHETQTERYAASQLKWRKDNAPLRFLYEATGKIIDFTDAADPRPRARAPARCSTSFSHKHWPPGRRSQKPCVDGWQRRCRRCPPRTCVSARSAPSLDWSSRWRWPSRAL